MNENKNSNRGKKMVIDIDDDLRKMSPEELADYTRRTISSNKKVDQHFIGEEYVMGIIGDVVKSTTLNIVIDSIKEILPSLLKEILAEMDETTIRKFLNIAERKVKEFFDKKSRQDYFLVTPDDMDDNHENASEYSDEQIHEAFDAMQDNPEKVTEENTKTELLDVGKDNNTVMQEDEKNVIIKANENIEEATQITIKEDHKNEIIIKGGENNEERTQTTFKEEDKEAMKIVYMDEQKNNVEVVKNVDKTQKTTVENTATKPKQIKNAEKVFICPRCNFSTAYRSIMKKHFKNKKACEAQGCIKLNDIVLTEDIKNKILNMIP